MPNSILATPDQVIAALESHGCKPKRSGGGWKAKCPAHDGKTQSLSVNDGDTGSAVIYCFSGCEYRDVMRALGLNQANSAKRQIVTTYDYDGHFETVRYSPKGFAQRRKQASGEYIWNLKGVAVRLYRQDDLMAAKPSQVVVVEGEKDVETLRGVEVLAVTNHGGAGKWRKAHTAALVEAKVKTVVVIPDSDEPGRDHGNKVAAECRRAGLTVKWAALPAKDATAYLGLNSQAALSALISSAADWTPPAQPEAKKGGTFDLKDASVLEEVFVRLGWQVRYNLRSMRCDWSLDAGANWGSTTDRAEKKRRRTIAETFSYNSVKEGKKIVRPLVYGRDAWEEHLGAILADHEVDPFRLWLEGLAPWDGVKRVHSLLCDTFKADDNPLTRWASTALLLGPVQRCFEPGCKLDEVVVLVGGQGLGKSSLINHLLPQTEPDWFSDSLSMADNQQRRIEALQGRVLVEMSDLQGFTKADMQSLKSFITRRDDGSVRLAFRKNPETMLRRCVLVGTSDRAECLPNDSAGLRRFVPVECREGCHVEQFMGLNRDRLWAEALAIYRKGEVRANLPRSLMTTQSARAETHRRKDGLIEDGVAAIVGDGPYTIRELFAMACPSSSISDRRAESRLADAARTAGWSKRRGRDDNGKLAYLWRRGD